MGEHNVWKILKKDRYTEEGIKKMEQIYDFLSVMKNTLGDLTIQEFFNMLNENNDDSRRLATTIHEAWITSGYVIAENIDEAKEKIGMSFDLTNGKYVLNFDLGESFMNKYYIQDDKNSDVFIEEFLLEEDEKQ